MKRCLGCGQLYPSHRKSCDSCGWEPARTENIVVWAPRVAREDTGFGGVFSPTWKISKPATSGFVHGTG